jgi:hypothetical protein
MAVAGAGEQETRMNAEESRMVMSLRIYVHFYGDMAA